VDQRGLDAEPRTLPKQLTDDLFRFPTAQRRDPEVDAWLRGCDDALGAIAARWLTFMRDLGSDVRELIHDGHPTVCAGDAAFAYIETYRAHVGVGFYRGAELPDPTGLLEGTGKSMRHVKLKPGKPTDDTALANLIRAAHDDMRTRSRAAAR